MNLAHSAQAIRADIAAGPGRPSKNCITPTMANMEAMTMAIGLMLVSLAGGWVNVNGQA